MHPRELLEAQMPLIDTIIARVCRRSRLIGAAAEDFASIVKVALIEDDYALLRDTAQASSIAAYLTVVIQRMAVDERVRAFGRWQPSAAARAMGEAGVLAETLLQRDRRTVDEALPLLQAVDVSITREQVAEIARALPDRYGRPRAVGLDAPGVDELRSSESADARTIAREREALAARAGAAVRDALVALPVEDQVILKFRFVSSMSIADISRMLRLPQRPLYRRLETLLGRLRGALAQANIDAASIEDLIGSSGAEVQSGLAGWKNEDVLPSSMEEGR